MFCFHSLSVSYNTTTEKEKIAAPAILPTYSKQFIFIFVHILFIFIFLPEYSYQKLWIVFCSTFQFA